MERRNERRQHLVLLRELGKYFSRGNTSSSFWSANHRLVDNIELLLCFYNLRQWGLRVATYPLFSTLPRTPPAISLSNMGFRGIWYHVRFSLPFLVFLHRLFLVIREFLTFVCNTTPWTHQAFCIHFFLLFIARIRITYKTARLIISQGSGIRNTANSSFKY